MSAFSASNVLLGIAYTGLGAGIGSAGAAFITTRAAKGESRAHAADMLATGYSKFSDHLANENERMIDEIRALRKVLIKLTDAMDLMLADNPGKEAALRAGEANDAAKMAL